MGVFLIRDCSELPKIFFFVNLICNFKVLKDYKNGLMRPLS